MAVIEGARFGHVNVTSVDWRRLADFYATVFGCELVPPERDIRSADLDAATTATWLDALRKPALGLGGYAAVIQTPHTSLDRWGYTPDAVEVMRALKQRWDSQGILNPGDFVVG